MFSEVRKKIEELKSWIYGEPWARKRFFSENDGNKSQESQECKGTEDIFKHNIVAAMSQMRFHGSHLLLFTSSKY